MSLDFHIANNSKEATYQSVDASFDLQSHKLIFNRYGLPEGRFPLFNRLGDYYKDAKYTADELEILIKETNQIKELFSDNNQLIQQLDILLRVYKKALKSKTNIWVFCD
ncbi:MAG: hypothetical protein ABJV04_06685 [Aliiglaciecola sp.]|uniref:hypothetical protein n=1 Tax=Aliiglaciecola sp. TaxID=1872441 RepID=UPI003297081F